MELCLIPNEFRTKQAWGLAAYTSANYAAKRVKMKKNLIEIREKFKNYKEKVYWMTKGLKADSICECQKIPMKHVKPLKIAYKFCENVKNCRMNSEEILFKEDKNFYIGLRLYRIIFTLKKSLRNVENTLRITKSNQKLHTQTHKH